MYTSPKPDHCHEDQREENGFQGDPDFGESTILVDGNKPNIEDVTNVLVEFEIRINRKA